MKISESLLKPINSIIAISLSYLTLVHPQKCLPEILQSLPDAGWGPFMCWEGPEEEATQNHKLASPERTPPFPLWIASMTFYGDCFLDTMQLSQVGVKG